VAGLYWFVQESLLARWVVAIVKYRTHTKGPAG